MKHTTQWDTVTYPNDPANDRIQGDEWNEAHALETDENFVTDAQLAIISTLSIEYDFQDKEVGGTYIYWGFDATGTGYRVVRQTVAGGAWAEAIGTYPTPYANYAAAWAARAALSYS